MRKRFAYAFLFGVPGFFFAIVVSFFYSGALFGLAWIFVFGDNPWPSWAQKVFPLLFIFTFLSLFLGSVSVGYRYGKKRESAAALDRMDLLISCGTTVALVFSIILYQCNAGNISPQSNSIFCADFCREQGFSTSSLPPKNSEDENCYCLDDTGREVLKIPLESLHNPKNNSF